MTTILILCCLVQDDDLVRKFLDGKAEAREKLLARGTAALPILLEARAKADDKSLQPVLDLLFAIKKASFEYAEDKAGKSEFEKLESTRLTVDFQAKSGAEILDRLRELTSLNLVLDAGSTDMLKKTFDLRRKDATVRSLLDALCCAAGIDYDWRYGVLWLGRRERLWQEIKPLSEEQAKRLRHYLTEMGKDSEKAEKLKDRKLTDAESNELVELEYRMEDHKIHAHNFVYAAGPGAFPILEEFCGSKILAVSKLCKDIGSSLRSVRFSAFPLRLSAIGKSPGSDLGRKIAQMKLDLSLDDHPLDYYLSVIRDYTGLNIVDLSGLKPDPFSLKVKDVTLQDEFAMIALPRGLDIEIREGVVVLIDPSKPRGPRVNRWKNQDLGEDESLAQRLEETRMSFDADGMAFDKVLEYVYEISGIRVDRITGTPEPSIRIKLADVSVAQFLAWITLPNGLDAKIQYGRVVVFKPDPRKEDPGPTFRSQKLEGEDEKLAAQLKGKKLDLVFEDTALKDVCTFIADVLELKLDVVDCGDRKITVKTADRSAWDALAILLSSQNLDAKIEKGKIVIFDPAKKK